jgi:hypothetical protein
MADAALAVRFDEAAAPATTGPGRPWVLMADGLHYYHRPGCVALAGLDARPVDPAALPAGAEPCGLCGGD